MLYYNGFFHPKMKYFVEKYCLLNNLHPEFLALSHENSLYMRGLRRTDVKEIKEQGFSSTDYEFYLTDKEDEGKYRLEAFYTKDELPHGRDLLRRWNEFMGANAPI